MFCTRSLLPCFVESTWTNKIFFKFKTAQQTATESSLISTDTNELATVNATLTTDTNELATVNATLTRLDHSQFTTEPLKSDFCGTETCACKTMANFTEEDLIEFNKNISKILKVDKKQTSSYRRSLISVMEERTSARVIGNVGVIFIVAVVGGICALDISRFLRAFKYTLGKDDVISKKKISSIEHLWHSEKQILFTWSLSLRWYGTVHLSILLWIKVHWNQNAFNTLTFDQKQKVLNIFGKDKTAGFELTTYRLVVCALNHCLILLFRYEVRHNMDVSQTTLNIIFWYWGGFILIYNEESETSKLELSILRTFTLPCLTVPSKEHQTKPHPHIQLQCVFNCMEFH